MDWEGSWSQQCACKELKDGVRGSLDLAESSAVCVCHSLSSERPLSREIRMSLSATLLQALSRGQEVGRLGQEGSYRLHPGVHQVSAEGT